MRNLFVDMDGVVADFDKMAEGVLGYQLGRGLRYPPKDWTKIVEANDRFYRSLELCEGALEFMESIKYLMLEHDLDVKFLTAIPKDNDVPWAVHDKLNWAQRYFPGFPVWIGPYSDDKIKHCRPGDILIDDRIKTITDWNILGGIGILHSGDLKESFDRISNLF